MPVVTRQQTFDQNQFVTEIEADLLISENKDKLQFLGDVRLSRDNQKISADRLYLFRQPDRLQASGNIIYSNPLYSLEAEQLDLDDTNHSGIFEQAEFQLYENHLRGSAQKIIQFDSDHSELHDVTYTTCDPQQNTWALSASKLELNQQSGQGTAHHAVLRIKDVPVFYFPWMMFPINDQRMSGLLTPTLAHSNIDGTQLALPFYWNMAENYDMTINPVWYSNRGLQINTENRYLFNDHSGQLTLSWLDDQIDNDERWYRSWSHEASLPGNIHSSILIQRVSDSDFLQDFEHLQGIEDVDFLKSQISFSSNIANWSAELLFDEYQTINLEKSISSRPYQRLPRLTLDRIFSPSESAFTIDWKNEWVQFDRPDSIVGDRLHITPLLSYPIDEPGYFIKPELQLDFTQYRLDNNTNDVNSIERSLPLFSLDSGLIFERLASSSNNWIQTLEPRIYFLYVPHEEQSEIPDFDTALLRENYKNIFINNRFSGADRVGDSRQISLGLTTRLLDQFTSREIFRASIGQAFFNGDRKVSLNSSIDDRDKSSLMTVINYKPEPEWDIQLASVYDQETSESRQTDFSIRHKSAKQAFDLEYHFRENGLEQSTLSFVYPVTVNWTVFAKRQHSIKRDRPVQNLFGLGYESCCWGFKLLYEESSDKTFDHIDRTVFFQMTFKGFSSAGNDIDTILENGILGYQSIF